VQVFADNHGNAVHLFERDCSVQRRHQKVIEEAPAPGMDAATREAVCGAAVRAALAVGYRGAGTVEFIADASEGLRADRIWFMEMNTRLQVEHPVTEMITGQDLVEWQLRVASGEPLPLTQAQIRLDGCAMEARLYAENPGADFLPSIGPLTHFKLPDALVRVDTGAEAGMEVSPFYDPMIAKLIAHRPSRAEAAEALAEACRAVEVWPVKTNAGFLARALSDPDFQAEDIDTGFIARRLDDLLPPHDPSPVAFEAAASALLARARPNAGGQDPWGRLAGFRTNSAPQRAAAVQFEDRTRWVEVPPDCTISTAVVDVAQTIVVFDAGQAYAFTEPRSLGLGDGGLESDGAVRSPMPGLIVATPVAVGDRVVKGQPVIALEAMKTEHSLAAPFDGLVAEVRAGLGEQVAEGVVLVRLTKEP
jgi:acetyl/propionyl-CoA carboxylase alpha subunit